MQRNHDAELLSASALALPGNNQHTLLFDTTRGPMGNAETVVPSASAPAPGIHRGKYGGRSYHGWVKSTGQGVTIIFELLTDRTGASGAASFEVDTNGPGGGSLAATAGVTTQFRWTPRTGDCRVRILAGATGPTTLQGEAWAVDADA